MKSLNKAFSKHPIIKQTWIIYQLGSFFSTASFISTLHNYYHNKKSLSQITREVFNDWTCQVTMTWLNDTIPAMLQVSHVKCIFKPLLYNAEVTNFLSTSYTTCGLIRRMVLPGRQWGTWHHDGIMSMHASRNLLIRT